MGLVGREVELDHDPVRVVDEDLVEAGARNRARGIGDLHGLKAVNHLGEAAGREGDVVEGAGAPFPAGPAADQVDDGPLAAIEPGAGEIERRPVAVGETEYLGVEPARAVEVGRVDGEVVETLDRHGVAPSSQTRDSPSA